MSDAGLTRGALAPTYRAMMRWTILMPVLAAGGCVNVSAPDKPIEINLNINVTQEVVYRLDSEAKQLIKQNPSIF